MRPMPTRWSNRASVTSIFTAHPGAKLKVWIDCPDPGWGSCGRQRHRSWWRLHGGQLPQSLRLPLRHGSGAAERRTAAHRHGRHSRRQDLAAVQVRLRPLGGRNFLPVELRHRHQDGVLADARAGSLPALHGVGAALQRLFPLVETLNYLENSRIIAGFPDIATPLLGYPPMGQIQLFIEEWVRRRWTRSTRACWPGRKGYSRELEAYGIRRAFPIGNCG